MPLANAGANDVPRECARPRNAAWVPKRKYIIVKPVVSNTPCAMIGAHKFRAYGQIGAAKHEAGEPRRNHPREALINVDGTKQRRCCVPSRPSSDQCRDRTRERHAVGRPATIIARRMQRGTQRGTLLRTIAGFVMPRVVPESFRQPLPAVLSLALSMAEPSLNPIQTDFEQ